MNSSRLLFASIHSYLDPSSGAALATRDLLELRAARGWNGRAGSCGVLDYGEETPLDESFWPRWSGRAAGSQRH
jgi:hypothetical protein